MFTPSLVPSAIDPMVIDKLAKDFKLESPFDVNLHAFVKVSLYCIVSMPTDLNITLDW